MISWKKILLLNKILSLPNITNDELFASFDSSKLFPYKMCQSPLIFKNGHGLSIDKPSLSLLKCLVEVSHLEAKMDKNRHFCGSTYVFIYFPD
jgi:hypothetical protein